jgi:hypothetical protein
MTMGVFWQSEAEVISQEPEIVKALIEEISNEEFEHLGLPSKPTSVFDLRIDDGSIFFNSHGYGYYGTNFENEASPQLFEKLFERYHGALFAFEHVHPCQSQGYHFNSQWAKPEGDLDWEDDTTYWIYRRMVTQETELDEGEFDIADCWHITLNELEAKQKNMPMLYALIQKAKAEGFDAWGDGEIGNIEVKDFISDDIVSSLIDEYWDEAEENQENMYSPFDDIERHMTEWVKPPSDFLDAEFEMPDDFPELRTTCAF